MRATKFDEGKPCPDLILRGMPLALLEVAKVGTFGAKKYSDDNWMGLETVRFRNAGQRHMLLRFTGEEYDPETHITHLAHEAWNKLAELELELRKANSN